MAYVALADKGLGDILPADDWNQLLDNVEAGPAALAQARGDLFEGTGLTELQRIAVGSVGTVIRARSTGNTYEAPLSVTPSDLDDASDDDKLILWGAAREAFLPMVALFEEIQGGTELVRGTSFTIDAPSGKTWDDWRWLSIVMGDSEFQAAETQRVRSDRLPLPATSHILYVVDASSARIGTVDVATGIATQLPNQLGSGFGNPRGLASHNGVLYVVDTSLDRIGTVDVATGIATQLPNQLGSGFGNPQGLASHNGVLYVVDASSDRIGTVDVATGIATQLPNQLGSGFGTPTGLASHNGVLYVVDTTSDRIGTVDVATGIATQLPNQLGSGFGNPTGLASHNGVLYVVDTTSDRIGTVDVATGIATQLPNQLGSGFGNPTGLASHGQGGTFLMFSEYASFQRTSDTRLTLHPTQNGYLHELVGIL